VVKTDQNFIFFDREAHILDRLYIMVLFKNFHFSQNSKGLPFGFTENVTFMVFYIKFQKLAQNTKVLDFDFIQFFGIFFSNFGSKSKGVSFRFY
jgi:hypothetical protein